MCVQHVELCHSMCTVVMRVIPKLSRYFTCMRCEGSIGQAGEKEEKYCDELETERRLTYLGVTVSGACEEVMTVSTRCGWVKFEENGKILCGEMLAL